MCFHLKFYTMYPFEYLHFFILLKISMNRMKLKSYIKALKYNKVLCVLAVWIIHSGISCIHSSEGLNGEEVNRCFTLHHSE